MRINDLDVLNIREEWVNAYFLDMIARLVRKSTHTQLESDEVFMLEFARHKVVEHHMCLVAASAEVPALNVIKGGAKSTRKSRAELHVITSSRQDM